SISGEREQHLRGCSRSPETDATDSANRTLPASAAQMFVQYLHGLKVNCFIARINATGLFNSL
ncbi:unnamed protein product, partial [Mesorhabditis spiculigera]